MKGPFTIGDILSALQCVVGNAIWILFFSQVTSFQIIFWMGQENCVIFIFMFKRSYSLACHADAKTKAICDTLRNLVSFVRLKTRENIHAGVLLLVKMQSNTSPWVFFAFLKLNKWYQIAQCITYDCHLCTAF